MRTSRLSMVGVAGLLALLAAGSGAQAEPGSLAAGERLFRSQCMGCHSTEPDQQRAGPSLHGVFGRRAGTIEGFDFSKAMQEVEIVWTPETLDAFLADPSAVVPGTNMVFWGLPPEQRGQVIDYLKEATE